MRCLARGESFLLLDSGGSGSDQWLRVRDGAGLEGYLSPDTRHGEIEEPARSAAEQDVIVGGLWLIGGIAVTAMTYAAAAQSGGRYVIAWGAILFGGIQFLKGLGRSAVK